MECRSIGHLCEGLILQWVAAVVVEMGFPGIWGHVVFARPGAVQFGVVVVVVVAGAPLPTEIRLISQELPKKRRRASSVLLGRSGPICMAAHVVNKHFAGLCAGVVSPLRRGSQLSMPCMYFTQCPSIEVVFEPPGLEPVEPKIPLPLPAHEPENSDAANYRTKLAPQHWQTTGRRGIN